MQKYEIVMCLINELIEILEENHRLLIKVYSLKEELCQKMKNNSYDGENDYWDKLKQWQIKEIGKLIEKHKNYISFLEDVRKEMGIINNE